MTLLAVAPDADPSAPPADPARPLAGRRVVVVNWRDLGHRSAGGSEHYAWHLCRALRDGGADVELLTARDAGQSAREVLEGITVSRAGGTLGFYPRTLLRVLRRRRRVDAVVDAASGIPAFTPLVLRRRTPVTLVVHHVHQDQFGLHFPTPVAAFGRFLERVVTPVVYRRCRTVAVSESTRAQMRERLGWRGPIDLVMNGAEQPSRPVDPAEKDPHRVAVLGRLVVHKRVDVVLEAVATLLQREPARRASLRVDVAGTGPQAEELAALVAALGLEDVVTLHGFVSEEAKEEILRRASVHVCASDAEGWGQVVIEAAAHGVPTIAREVPGLRDSVVDGVTGTLVPADAAGLRDHLVAALAASLEEAADPAARRRRVEACTQHAARFGWDAMRASALELVADDVRRSGSRSRSTARPDGPAEPIGR